jgi:hypothetical protein
MTALTALGRTRTHLPGIVAEPPSFLAIIMKRSAQGGNKQAVSRPLWSLGLELVCKRKDMFLG